MTKLTVDGNVKTMHGNTREFQRVVEVPNAYDDEALMQAFDVIAIELSKQAEHEVVVVNFFGDPCDEDASDYKYIMFQGDILGVYKSNYDATYHRLK